MNGRCLGSALLAGWICTGVAAAADPPEPRAVDTVRVCDAYGNGYYFVPGSETCLRLRGEIRLDAHHWSIDRAALAGLNPPRYTVFRETPSTARATFYFDAVTPSELGLIRAHFQVSTSFRERLEGAVPAIAVNALSAATIRLGGGTFGHRPSFFDDAQVVGQNRRSIRELVRDGRELGLGLRRGGPEGALGRP